MDWKDFFESPDNFTSILNYLSKNDSYGFVFISSSLKKHPLLNASARISYSRVFLGYPPKYLEIKDKLPLSPPRSGSEGTVSEMRADRVSYSGNIYKTLFTKEADIGFLVFIPVPLLPSYQYGGDRDPYFIAKSYIEAAGLDVPVRVVLGLNVKDDVYSVNDRTDALKKKVFNEAKKWNELFIKESIAAWVEPFIWGCANYEGDLIRQFIAGSEMGSHRSKMQFPFASVRKGIIDSPSCKRMIAELKESCERVYYVTGDADLVGLGSTDSVLKEAALYLSASKNKLVRFGGVNKFSSHEILYHISKFGLSDANKIKSVLFTHLCHSLDFAFRAILDEADPLLAYYSEINTFISEDFLNGDYLYNDKPIKESLCNSISTVNNDGGDFMCMLTRAIRTNHLSVRQVFYAASDYPVVTSSRHELVVVANRSVKDKTKLFKNMKKKQCLFSLHNFGIDSLKDIFSSLKNMQLTPSQINSRFQNAGYNTSGNSFHDFILSYSTKCFPFVIYFLTRESVPKDSIKKKKSCGRKSSAYKKSMNVLMPETNYPVCAGSFLKHLQSVVKNQDKVCADFKLNHKKLKYPQNQGKFTANGRSLCSAICRTESLLRWGFANAKHIVTTDFTVEEDFYSKDEGNVI